MSLTLYEHPFALYCQKVLIALYERGLAFETAIEQDDFAREELAKLWPMASIPMLRDEGADLNLPETSIIIEYLDGLEAEGPAMIPADRAEALEARRWDRFCDNYVSTPVQTVVGDALEPENMRRPDAVAQARSTLDTAYRVLDDQLAEREWLGGEEFGLADCSAAPGLFYALVVNRWDEEANPALTRYYRGLAQRPSYARVVEEARPYRDVFPIAWPEDVDRYHG